jgi:uncharacterized membrane protein
MWIFFALGAALLVALLTPAIIRRGGAAIGALGSHRRQLLLAGLIAGTAPVLGYNAFSLGLVGYVTTLFKLSTVMTVPWSFVFLGERGIARRLPSSAVMLIGAILLAI